MSDEVVNPRRRRLLAITSGLGVVGTAFAVTPFVLSMLPSARAKAAGATPIRVRLPVNGQLFKLEKILALPQDKLFFGVAYREWKPAE